MIDHEKARSILSRLKLKILVVTPIDGGSLPTARFTAAALKKLGHQVESFEADQFCDGFKKIAAITPDENDTSLLRTSYVNLLGEGIIAMTKQFKPDLLVALAQAPINPGVLQRLRAMNVPTAFWFVEDFRTLLYWKEIAHFYDYFFTIQRGDFFKELDCLGVKHYYYLPQACCPAVHKKIFLTEEEKEEFGAGISFMGAGYYNRQLFLKGLIDFDFKIWGTDWDMLSPLWKKVQRCGARISSDDCIKIYNAARINLNLHSSTFHDGVNPHGDFINPRTFEIASCGGFQLVDYRSYLPECFKIDEEIVTYTDMYELKEKVRYYMANPDEMSSIAIRGQKRAIACHTFKKRMEEMLLYIIENDMERFDCLVNKESEVDRLIKEAGKYTELGIYLSRFKDKKNISLADIIYDIENGKGGLSRPEAIFLMMDQFLMEKK